MIGEHSDAQETVNELLSRRHESPISVLRATTAEISRRRFDEGLVECLPVEEARHALESVEDPRVRTSFTYLVAYVLAQRAEYDLADDWVALLMTDVEEFDLVRKTIRRLDERSCSDWETSVRRSGTPSAIPRKRTG